MNEKYKVDQVNNDIVEFGVTPPPPSSLISPFSPKASEVAMGVMGTENERQMSLGKNTPLYKKSCGSYKK